MTVRELIEHLEKFDGDLVVIKGEDRYYLNCFDIETPTVACVRDIDTYSNKYDEIYLEGEEDDFSDNNPDEVFEINAVVL